MATATNPPRKDTTDDDDDALPTIVASSPDDDDGMMILLNYCIHKLFRTTPYNRHGRHILGVLFCFELCAKVNLSEQAGVFAPKNKALLF